MAQHMGMSFDAQIGRDDCPPDYRLEGGAAAVTASSRHQKSTR
jgi:hypothetical protein